MSSTENYELDITQKQYSILLSLYNEFPEAFASLDGYIKSKFYSLLYAK